MLRWVLGGGCLLLLGWLCCGPGLAATDDGRAPSRYRGKKILWIDSYHAGYEWSQGLERGIRGALAGSGAELKVWRMDTKRHSDEEYGRLAGQRARAVVARYRPDLVIASDDNAQRYLVVPYLKDTDLPVVFCGVNRDPGHYGYPCRNVTGMAEVELVEGLVRHLSRYARGDRIGVLGGDVHTTRIVTDQYNQQLFDGRLKRYLVRSFAEFKRAFLLAQQEVDVLLVRNNAGINDWDAAAAEAFLLENVVVPTGSVLPWMKPYNVLTMAKVPEEQGEYAAATALRIFAGARPEEVPVVSNRMAQLVVNLKMAKAAGIVLPVSLLQTAEVIGQEAYGKAAAVVAEGY